MKRGFDLVEFDAGVPMVPRPKSEAWLLCGKKSPPYTGCQMLEDSPGNDGSPHSLKTRLAGLVGHEPSAQEQADWFTSPNGIDPRRIEMHSFTCFRMALDAALDAVLSTR